MHISFLDSLDMLPDWCAYIGRLLPRKKRHSLKRTSNGEDVDEEGVNNDEEEEGKVCCSMLLMMSLRLCQILSPLQNACGAGQRRAKAAGKQTSAVQKSYCTLTFLGTQVFACPHV